MIAGLIGSGDLWTRGEGAEGKSVGDALGGDQNVGLDPIVLDGEHLSGTSESGLHFVGNEKNSVLVEDFLDLAEIIPRRNYDATLAENWLGDERSDVT